MNLSLENIINQKIVKIFQGLSLDTRFAIVKNSDRPDLSDFQCNGALALAKMEKKNPREIATIIAAELEKDEDFSKISIDGPGFINMSLNDAFIAKILNAIAKDSRFGASMVSDPHTVVLDFGGPNVAKAMHVGHLRSGVIGEAVQRIERFVGNTVISDVHFGDWGTPIGMILAEVIIADGNLDKMSTYNIDEITSFYKQATIRCKEDEQARDNARDITVKFQDGDETFYKAWKHLRDVSVEAVKANYKDLDVNFDLWLGESDAHKTCAEVIKIAEEKNILVDSEGAKIIWVEKIQRNQCLLLLW